MLDPGFIAVAVVLRLLGNAGYLIGTWKGRVKPNIVSWFFWGVTALVAFAVQISKGAGPEAYVTLAIAVGPLAVFAMIIHRGSYKVNLSYSDKWCAALTMFGMVLWLITNNPVSALLMSILADIASSIPTILKSYLAPHTEHALPYTLSIVSMVVTLLTINNWGITHWAFPAYILLINLTFVVLILMPKGWRRHKRRRTR